ncbi:MAG: MmcQ/YjbR family DNA-binding protein [Acidimicrobiia bacterium]
MISIDEIRTIALALPGSFEQSSYGGRPSWRTKRRMFTWVRDDPEALVIWVDSIDERDALVAAEPDTFFTTSHYDNHPIVLVCLDRIDGEEAAELITDSYRHRAEPSLVLRLDQHFPG